MSQRRSGIESGVCVLLGLLGTNVFNVQWPCGINDEYLLGGRGQEGAGIRQENGFTGSVLFARWLTEKDGDGVVWVSNYLSESQQVQYSRACFNCKRGWEKVQIGEWLDASHPMAGAFFWDNLSFRQAG